MALENQGKLSAFCDNKKFSRHFTKHGTKNLFIFLNLATSFSMLVQKGRSKKADGRRKKLDFSRLSSNGMVGLFPPFCASAFGMKFENWEFMPNDSLLLCVPF
ncbi:MAG: hypothetical protein ACHBN1_12680 [Heteroscytonema crispum UTEX LB 1556]